MYPAVGGDPHDVRVVRPVMDLAEGQAVGHLRLAPFVFVFEIWRASSSSGVELVKGAPLPIASNQLAKAMLVQPPLDHRRRIRLQRRLGRRPPLAEGRPGAGIGRDLKLIAVVVAHI